MHDRSIMPVLIALKGCLCDALDERGLSANCKCELLYGVGTNPQPPAVGGGYAWVGVNSVYPSADLVSPTNSLTNCTQGLAANLTVGVLRCFQASPQGVTAEQSAEYLEMQMADMAAMRYAVQCCAGDDFDVILGQYAPAEAEGGVYGGTWSLTVSQYG